MCTSEEKKGENRDKIYIQVLERSYRIVHEDTDYGGDSAQKYGDGPKPKGKFIVIQENIIEITGRKGMSMQCEMCMRVLYHILRYAWLYKIRDD